MIKYKLICKNCDLSFDSWFASSKEFDKLKKKNFLNCYRCDSKKIEKTLMAPKSILKSDSERSQDKIGKLEEINKKIKSLEEITGKEVFALSSVTNKGLEEILNKVLNVIKKNKQVEEVEKWSP